MPASLSELTPIKFDMELTHLDSENSNSKYIIDTRYIIYNHENIIR